MHANTSTYIQKASYFYVLSVWFNGRMMLNLIKLVSIINRFSAFDKFYSLYFNRPYFVFDFSKEKLFAKSQEKRHGQITSKGKKLFSFFKTKFKKLINISMKIVVPYIIRGPILCLFFVYFFSDFLFLKITAEHFTIMLRIAYNGTKLTLFHARLSIQLSILVMLLHFQTYIT